MPRRRSTTTRRTRRRSTSSTAAAPASVQPAAQRTATRRRRSTTRSTVDPEKVLESVLDELVASLGLDILGLSRDQYREMLKPIIEGLLSTYSSRPSNETIIARLRATAQNVYVMASAYLLEKLEKLTPEQLEFVVANGGPVAGKYAPKLYRLAVELGRKDLIPQIRYLWETYGSPTPITCPHCGFRAVTPELKCMVCGYEPSEREVKEAIDFREKLREFAEEASVEELREAIERGYVLVGEVVKAPSAPREPLDVELRLDRSEVEELRKLLEVKRSGRGAGVARAA